MAVFHVFFVQPCVDVSSYEILYGTVDRTEWHEADFFYDVFFICGKTRVICYHRVISVSKIKIDEYVKTQVISNHIVVHLHANKDTRNAQDSYIWLKQGFVVGLRV